MNFIVCKRVAVYYFSNMARATGSKEVRGKTAVQPNSAVAEVLIETTEDTQDTAQPSNKRWRKKRKQCGAKQGPTDEGHISKGGANPKKQPDNYNKRNCRIQRMRETEEQLSWADWCRLSKLRKARSKATRKKRKRILRGDGEHFIPPW